MVVREMLLNRIEELLLGCARELRPALAVGDPPVPFDDRCAAVVAPHLEMCPAEGVLRAESTRCLCEPRLVAQLQAAHDDIHHGDCHAANPGSCAGTRGWCRAALGLTTRHA